MPEAISRTAPYVVVLGVAQDAGHPQAACRKDCCRAAWADPAAGHRVASLGIVDPRSGRRWLIEATPDLPEQLRALAAATPIADADTPDGIFITHGHVGHYTGLMHLGREAMGAAEVPVWVMPRMAEFLSDNGPWSQLVTLDNVELRALEPAKAVELAPDLRVRSFLVPHRDEFSETAGFVVEGADRSVLWLPDIDKWDRWDRRIEDVLAQVDVAFLDGTFYADGEVGRAMSEIPHPFISESMSRLAPLPPSERAKVRFVHFNHTNPAMREGTDAAAAVASGGFGLAREGEIFDLQRQ